MCVCWRLIWVRPRRGGGDEAAAQEMMHPLGVREAAGRRLAAPGSTNVSVMFIKLKAQAAASIRFVGERLFFFPDPVFCFMEQQETVISRVPADFRPVGGFERCVHSAPRWPLPSWKKSLDLK